jgi:hypothetical protein
MQRAALVRLIHRRVRTIRCTQAADRPLLDGEFSCRRWVIGGVISKTERDLHEKLMSNRLPHHYCIGWVQFENDEYNSTQSADDQILS